jgi:hypothetical protein
MYILFTKNEIYIYVVCVCVRARVPWLYKLPFLFPQVDYRNLHFACIFQEFVSTNSSHLVLAIHTPKQM